MECSNTGGDQEWIILTAAECLRLFDEVEGCAQQLTQGKIF